MWYKYGPYGKIQAEYEDITALSIMYPQFQSHFPLLLDSGVITKIDTDNYRWNFSKSSMVQYFKFIDDQKQRNVEWGTWSTIESIFKLKKGTLRRLASTNGNLYKLENPEKKAKDFEKILKILI
jgi:hypothetical protein